MKTYKITGYIKTKEKEEDDWKKMRDDLIINLPDEINPYEAIEESLKLQTSNWLFTLDEISEEKARKG